MNAILYDHSVDHDIDIVLLVPIQTNLFAEVPGFTIDLDPNEPVPSKLLQFLQYSPFFPLTMGARRTTRSPWERERI